jgi:hypothetical protein
LSTATGFDSGQRQCSSQDAEDVPKLNYEAPNILKVMQGLAAEALNKGLAHYGVSEGEDSISSNRCRTRVASSR